MASSRLEKLRANMAKNTEKTERRPNNYYPFFAMDFDESATVRLLPDKNESNPLDFVVEKVMHNLIINGERKSVPCLTMYGHSPQDCPICKVSSAFFKEEGKTSVRGKQYWRKKQHIAQCLILEDPLPADKETEEKHTGKVRFLNIGFQLFNVIEETFKADELDEVPYDYDEGCNLVIKKTKQGDNAKYDAGSRFARKATALTKEEVAVAEESMIDLSTLLPKEPEVEELDRLLQASLTGGDYEGGNSAPAPKKETPAPAPKAEAAAEEESSTPEPAADESDDDVDDVMAAIKARRANRAS